MVIPNDQQLKDDVEQELRWEPSVHAEQIGVSVKDGVVELDGHVPSYYEKWTAERTALRVAKVKALASDIKVDLPYEASRTDEDIARTALEHLSWNTWIPGTIKVKATDGWVTLSGSVEWRYQSEEAERAIRLLRGVKGVTDEVEVRPKVNAAGVKSKIEDALRRSAVIDADHITVETSGSSVTLRGDVGSWAEREKAEETTWAAPGVSEVENYITIR